MSQTSFPFAQHVPGLDDPSLLHGFLPGTREPAPRATRMMLGTLGFTSLLIASLFALYAILSTYQMAHLAHEFSAMLLYFLVPAYSLATALTLVGAGAMLFLPRPTPWRLAMRFALWTMSVSLAAILFGLGLGLCFRGSAHDDRLIRGLGLIIAGVWSVPFWLTMLLRAYLDRTSPRRAFGMDDDRMTPAAGRTAARLMWIAYLSAAALAVACRFIG